MILEACEIFYVGDSSWVLPGDAAMFRFGVARPQQKLHRGLRQSLKAATDRHRTMLSDLLRQIDIFVKAEIDYAECPCKYRIVDKNFTHACLANSQTIVRILKNFCRYSNPPSEVNSTPQDTQASAVRFRQRSTGQGIAL